MNIDDETLAEVGQYLQGSCKSTLDAIEHFGLSIEEGLLEQRLLDVEVEICVNCHWWHEVCELEYVEDESGGVCEQCRESLGIEI